MSIAVNGRAPMLLEAISGVLNQHCKNEQQYMINTL